MNISYKILCVEDEQTWFDLTQRELNEHLDECGFIPVVFQNTGADIPESVYCDPTLNLIMMDLNLARGNSGADIIRSINEKKVFTDVLFYSSVEGDAQRSIAQYDLQGVYHCDRVDVVDKAKEVIDFALKRIGDTNAMRALVLSEVAILDSMIHSALLLKIDSLSDVNLQTFAKKTLARFEKQNNSLSDKIASWTDLNATTLNAMVTDLAFDSNKKAESLSSLSKIYSCCKDERTTLAAYWADVLSHRNVLAHEPCQGSGCIEVDGTTYNEGKFLELRKNLIHHKSNIESLCDLIMSA